MEDLVAPLNRVGDEQGSVRNDDGVGHHPRGLRGGLPGRTSTPAGAACRSRPSTAAAASRGWSASPCRRSSPAPTWPSRCARCSPRAPSTCSCTTAREEQQEIYLPKMVTGEWTGTMNLTEPQAGSDVGALRTKAVPQDDGTYRITGTKIFITLRRARHEPRTSSTSCWPARPTRRPAPRASRCFIVPEVPRERRRLARRAQRRHLRVASSTRWASRPAPPACSAYGDDGRGRRRLPHRRGERRHAVHVHDDEQRPPRRSGLEGLALAERAYQTALAYAKERRQGRAPGAPAGEQSLDHRAPRRAPHAAHA